MLTLAIVDYTITALAIAIVAVLAMRRVRGASSALDLREAPARPNRFREDAVLLAVCIYLLAAATLHGLMGLIIHDPDDIRVALAVNNGAHIAGIAACLLIAKQRFDGGIVSFCFGRPAETHTSEQPTEQAEPLHSIPPLAKNPCETRTATVITVTVVILCIGLCPLVRDVTINVLLLFNPQYDFAAHPTIAALHNQPRSLVIVAALWTGAIAIAPIAEELFFRGLVQTFVTGIIPGRWFAIAVTSLAFGLIHFQQPHAIPALVLLAILVGYAYERTGSLLPPVIIHAAFNLKTLVWDALAAHAASLSHLQLN